MAHQHKKTISAKNIVRQDIINVCEKCKYNYDKVVELPPHGTSAHTGYQ